MNIAGEQYQYKYTAIQSISEFSAIDGGVASIMLANLGPFTWAVTVMNFAAQIQCFPDFSWDAADVCEIIGVTGLVMIGLFELDPHNKWMKIFHYIGAAAGACTVLGFLIQGVSLSNAQGGADSDSDTSSSSSSSSTSRRLQQYDTYDYDTYDSDSDSNGGGGGGAGYLVLPVFIALVCGVLFIAWQCGFNKATSKYEEELEKEVWAKVEEECKEVIDERAKSGENQYQGLEGIDLLVELKNAEGKRIDKDHLIEHFFDEARKEEIRQKISCFSLKNVISEAIFLFGGATALCVYLMQYDIGCCTGCSHAGDNYC